MAAKHVDSPYGTLALNASGFPQLQFEDSDVFIELGEQAEEWLFVHSKVLAAASPYFAGAFSGAWGKHSGYKNLRHPVTAKIIGLKTLALKAVDDAYLLEGQVFLKDTKHRAQAFQYSSYASPGWAKSRYERNDSHTTTRAEEAGHAVCILIALMYGPSISLPMVSADSGDDDQTTSLPPRVVDCSHRDIATICAYAEYFQCLDLIGPMLTKLLLDVRSLWPAVAQSPLKWYRLAMKLRCSNIIYDAYRHMVARAYWYEDGLKHDYSEETYPKSTNCDWTDVCWGAVSALTDYSEEELHEMYDEPLDEVVGKMEQLKRDLIRLFLDALRFRAKKPRSEGKKIDDKSEYLARSIYGDWVVQLLYGEVLEPGFGGRPKRGLGRLNHIVRKLEEAAASDNPAKLFGYDSPGMIARTFNLPQKQIHFRLCVVVEEAADLIKAAFPEHGREPFWDQQTYEYLGDMIAGRPHYDDHWDGYIAYVWAPANLPFEPVDASEPIAALKIVPDVDVTPASEAWLKAVVDATKEYDEQAAVRAEELRALEDAEDSGKDDVEEDLDDQEHEGQASGALADWGSVWEGLEEEA